MKSLSQISSFWVLNFNQPKVKLLVKPGAEIKKGVILSKIEKTKEIWLDLSAALSVRPTKINKFLKIPFGCDLKKGDLVAGKKNFWGKRKEIFSPCTGVFKEIDQARGRIKILKKKVKKINSPIRGRVIEADQTKIKIEFQAKIFPGEGKGKERIWGELKALDSRLPYFQLNISFKNKIVLVPKIDEMLLSKAKALGVKAMVTRKLKAKKIFLPVFIVKDYNDLVSFSGKEVLLDFPEKRILVCD